MECSFSGRIFNVNNIALEILSKREVETEDFQKKLQAYDIDLSKGDIYCVLKDLRDLGLVFAKGNAFTTTFLGKLASLGLYDVYESITKRRDLFDFFSTRIPTAFPDEILLKFKIGDDFNIIGKPDLTKRIDDLMNEVHRLLPNSEKEILVLADLLHRPTVSYALAGLKKSPKIRMITSQIEYARDRVYLNLVKKIINTEFEVKIIDDNPFIGLFCIDDNKCLFGFRDLFDMSGWDALIYTEDKECICWVKESFYFIWNNLSKKPESIDV